MQSLKNAQVGETVRFYYSGGSDPGTSRVVRVTAMENNAIRGVDLAKEEPRTYLFDRAYNPTVIALADEVVVFPREYLAIPADTLSGEVLLSIYRQLNPKVKLSVWNEEVRAVVAKVPEAASIGITFDGRAILLSYHGEGQDSPLFVRFEVPSNFTGISPVRIVSKLTQEQAREHARRVSQLFTPCSPQAPPSRPAETTEEIQKRRLYKGPQS